MTRSWTSHACVAACALPWLLVSCGGAANDKKLVLLQTTTFTFSSGDSAQILWRSDGSAIKSFES